jgi:RNA polymerase sigma-70 factor (sigma-E family)
VNEPRGFAEFVSARSAALLRSAWLLTGDEASAQDLVQSALAKTWARWERVERKDAPEAYVRQVMITTYLTWRRRRWHGEIAVGDIAEPDEVTDAYADADLRQVVALALGELPRGQRAVLVLRYFDDMTEPQAATALGCSVGTVKSQSSKALARLRASKHFVELFDAEVSHESH